MKTGYPCACCGYLTLDEGPGSFDICDVCYWQDDDVQNRDPDRLGGANAICLNEAKVNFKELGACSAQFVEDVRRPTAEEYPVGSKN